MSDWIFDNFGLFVGALLCIVFAVLIIVAKQEEKQRDRFMQECTQDRKRYECEAMWRDGESKTVAVPVVIPVR